MLPPHTGGGRAGFASNPVADLTYFDREASPATVPPLRHSKPRTPVPQPVAVARQKTPQPQSHSHHQLIYLEAAEEDDGIYHTDPRRSRSAQQVQQNLTIPSRGQSTRHVDLPVQIARRPSVQYRNSAHGYGPYDQEEDEDEDYSDEDEFTAVGTGVGTDITDDSEDSYYDAREHHNSVGRYDEDEDEDESEEETEVSYAPPVQAGQRRSSSAASHRDDYYNAAPPVKAQPVRRLPTPIIHQSNRHDYKDTSFKKIKPSRQSDREPVYQQPRFREPLPPLSDITDSTEGYEDPLPPQPVRGAPSPGIMLGRKESYEQPQLSAKSPAPQLKFQPPEEDEEEVPVVSGRRAKTPTPVPSVRSKSPSRLVNDADAIRRPASSGITRDLEVSAKKVLGNVKQAVEKDLPQESDVEKELIRLLKVSYLAY